MALVKHGAVVADPWRRVDAADDLPADGPVFVPLDLWQAARDRLRGRNAPLGLRLASDQSPELVAEDIGHFAAVALEFPKFTDGRAYSYARILRERLGFAGEIRAVGTVLRDQALFMQRCGFDAFEIADDQDPAAWTTGPDRFAGHYQPASDDRPVAARLRRANAGDGRGGGR
jgi:uncharacterized protein (DUF934 family)